MGISEVVCQIEMYSLANLDAIEELEIVTLF